MEERDKKAHILLVDDETAVRDVIEDVLVSAGYSVHVAADGRQGIRAFFTWKPGLVVLDLMMPVMDGWNLLERIREVSEVPIIVLTALGQEDVAVRALRGGADDYVVKPSRLSEFKARVEALLRKSHLEDIEDPPNKAIENSRVEQATKGATNVAPQQPSGQSPGLAGPMQKPETERAHHISQTLLAERPEPQEAYHPLEPDIGLEGLPGAPEGEAYEGIVKLSVKTGGSVRQALNFVDELYRKSELRILRLLGSDHKAGLDIWLGLRQPLSLKEMLLQMGEVAEVDAPPGCGPKSDGRMISVRLKETPSPAPFGSEALNGLP